MIARLHSWYLALSRREQYLVAIAITLAVVTLIWATTVIMLGALESAHTRHADAVRRLADTQARVAAVADESRSPPPGLSAPIDVAVRAKAQAAGFALSNDSIRADGAVDIAIASARAPALFAWISGLERDGLIVQSFAATNNGDRTLAVQMTLKKRGS